MSEIMDLLQTRYPDMIVAMYSSASDLLLLNILPSQYAGFISLMKDLKGRLVNELGLSQAWTDFLAEFKKKHHSKRKLIQMLGLISESGWDLEAMVKREESAKGKRKVPAASPTPVSAKKVKVEPSKFIPTNVTLSPVASDDEEAEEEEKLVKNNKEPKGKKKEEKAEKKDKKETKEKKPERRKDDVSDEDDDDDVEMEDVQKKKFAKAPAKEKKETKEKRQKKMEPVKTKSAPSKPVQKIPWLVNKYNAEEEENKIEEGEKPKKAKVQDSKESKKEIKKKPAPPKKKRKVVEEEQEEEEAGSEGMGEGEIDEEENEEEGNEENGEEGDGDGDGGDGDDSE